MTDEVMEAYLRQYRQAQHGVRSRSPGRAASPRSWASTSSGGRVDGRGGAPPAGMTVEHTIQTNGDAARPTSGASSLPRTASSSGSASTARPSSTTATGSTAAGGRRLDQGPRGGSACLQSHGVDVNVLCTVQRRQPGPPARRLPLLPRRARCPLHPVHPHRRGRDDARVPGGDTVTDRRSTRWRGAGSSRRCSTSGCAATSATVFVQMFDGALAGWCAAAVDPVHLPQTCGDGVALEHNGDLYSCDHFVEPPHLLGNIMETPMVELVRSEPAGVRAGQGGHAARYCRACEVRFACNGECPRNRFLRRPTASPASTTCAPATSRSSPTSTGRCG